VSQQPKEERHTHLAICRQPKKTNQHANPNHLVHTPTGRKRTFTSGRLRGRVRTSRTPGQNVFGLKTSGCTHIGQRARYSSDSTRPMNRSSHLTKPRVRRTERSPSPQQTWKEKRSHIEGVDFCGCATIGKCDPAHGVGHPLYQGSWVVWGVWVGWE